ncbi:C-type lectin domain family 4 member D-like [Hoplias malabaricus]|uniref:C-type lectin domain family 4 member D-like n=1 Tax=Hoplias malabaricus TaxID=27720 RepID=UPI00346251C1
MSQIWAESGTNGVLLAQTRPWSGYRDLVMVCWTRADSFELHPSHNSRPSLGREFPRLGPELSAHSMSIHHSRNNGDSACRHRAKCFCSGVHKENEIKKLEAEKQKLCDLSKGDACCAEGWKYFSGKCYYFSTDKKTWNASRDACVAEGGHLVIVSSTEEQDFLKKSAPFSGEHFYWVGLTDAVTEGDWRWLDGTPLSATPPMWYSGQPDNWKGKSGEHPEGEDCAATCLSSKSYLLYDKFCDANEDSFYRVCEAITQIK